MQNTIKRYKEMKKEMNKLEAQLDIVTKEEAEEINAKLDSMDDEMFELEDELQALVQPILEANGYTTKEVNTMFVVKADKACELAIKYAESID